jgi:hypothetical protein
MAALGRADRNHIAVPNNLTFCYPQDLKMYKYINKTFLKNQLIASVFQRIG